MFEDEKDLESKLYRHIQVKVNEGKFRPMWDSDIIAASENDEELANQINNHFPLVAENVIKKDYLSGAFRCGLECDYEKIDKISSHMCDALIFLAQIGACNNLVFRNGCVELAQKESTGFLYFFR